MSKFKGVLIGSDLDGTLLSIDHTVSQKNIDAINYFIENGGTFTITTGRPPMSVGEILPNFNFQIPAVLLNGAIIFDMNNKKVISSKTLPPKAMDFCINMIEKFPDVGLEIYTATDIHMINCSGASEKHFNAISKPNKVEKFDEIPDISCWFKANFTHDDSEYLKKVETYFIENYGNEYQHCYSCKQFFEVNNINARKDITLFEVSESLGFSKEHIYTIGDNFNDLYMIKNAKLGFCPSNAVPEVKEVAHKVLSSHNDGAVAEMIYYIDTLY